METQAIKLENHQYILILQDKVTDDFINEFTSYFTVDSNKIDSRTVATLPHNENKNIIFMGLTSSNSSINDDNYLYNLIGEIINNYNINNANKITSKYTLFRSDEIYDIC